MKMNIASMVKHVKLSWNLLCTLHQMLYQQVCLMLFRTCIIRKEFSQFWKKWLSITHQVRKLEGLEQERNGCNFQLERKNLFSLLLHCEYLIYVKFIIFSSNRQSHYWSQQPQDRFYFPMWPRAQPLDSWRGSSCLGMHCPVLGWLSSCYNSMEEALACVGFHVLLGLMQMCRVFGLFPSTVSHTTDSRKPSWWLLYINFRNIPLSHILTWGWSQ